MTARRLSASCSSVAGGQCGFTRQGFSPLSGLAGGGDPPAASTQWWQARDRSRLWADAEAGRRQSWRVRPSAELFDAAG